MVHLEPNTVDGLIWGLENFDAAEFDIRLTKDDKLVIYHDPVLTDGKCVRDLTEKQYRSYNLPTLDDLLNNKRVQELSKSGKKFFIELKPDCDGKKAIRDEISELLHDTFVKYVDRSDISLKSINMLSFDKKLLVPFAREDNFPVFTILPYINECNEKYVLMKALPRVIRHNLKWHINDALKNNYTGVTFARQYILGIFSKLNPSYGQLCDLMDETGVILGTNLGTEELEDDFSRFLRFTDKTQNYPRYAKQGDGMIIAHRGTGTKGVNLQR